MTCIAGKPGIIVADTQVTGETKGRDSKVYRINGYLVGFAGDMGRWQALAELTDWPKRLTRAALVRFCNDNRDTLIGDGSPDDGCDVLIVTRTKVFELDGCSVTEVPVGVVGSGAKVARGYLEAKPEDVEGAVRAACKLDPSCSEPIQVTRTARARGVK